MSTDVAERLARAGHIQLPGFRMRTSEESRDILPDQAVCSSRTAWIPQEASILARYAVGPDAMFVDGKCDAPLNSQELGLLAS